MHATVSGLVEYLAEDDSHALTIARDIVARLGWNDHVVAVRPRLGELAPGLSEGAPPLYDPDELAGVVPVDYRKPYDVREVLIRVVDGSEFSEFKPRYGNATVCVKTKVMGMACGVVGNNGPIDPDGAAKGAQFFQLCDQSNIPIIFLNNITGYMVGTEYERAGMIKHGAKMIQAVSNVRVPRIALYIGASYGAGIYGMSGYAFRPDFLFAWPIAATGVMGGEQAAEAMALVAESIATRKGQTIPAEALQAQKEAIRADFHRQEDAFYTSGRVLDHGVIDPRDTRRVLGFALETCLEARRRQLQPNSFGVARM